MRNMHFYKALYLSTSLEKKKRQLKWKLKRGKILPGIYVIALTNNGDLLEIYQSVQLKQRFYKKNPPYIIGIADGYNGAVELVQKILNDALTEISATELNKNSLENYLMNRAMNRVKNPQMV